jgi:hypothetical protein
MSGFYGKAGQFAAQSYPKAITEDPVGLVQESPKPGKFAGKVHRSHVHIGDNELARPCCGMNNAIQKLFGRQFLETDPQ